MEKEFLPYEQALELKELGFDEPCIAYYMSDDNIDTFIVIEKCKKVSWLTLAPTWQSAFSWFREKYHIHGEPFYKGGTTKQTSWYDYKIYSTIDWICNNPKQQWKTYEEAQLECLVKLIDIVKKQNLKG
jgi:hypothetical protein